MTIMVTIITTLTHTTMAITTRVMLPIIMRTTQTAATQPILVNTVCTSILTPVVQASCCRRRTRPRSVVRRIEWRSCLWSLCKGLRQTICCVHQSQCRSDHSLGRL